jgi:hypothetical protein
MTFHLRQVPRSRVRGDIPSPHILLHEVVLNLARQIYLYILERELRIAVMYPGLNITILWSFGL